MKLERMSADAVIIGSGPGGATVARDLTLKGKKVIILEWGGNNAPHSNTYSGYKFTGGMRALGKGVMISSDFLTMIRAITVGGTSMMYTGTAWNPPPKMFKKYGVDLSKELKEIRSELSIITVPDSLVGPGAKAIRKSARELGYKWDNIEKFLTPDKCVTNCNGCYFGCKRGAKWHARDWIIDAVSKGAVLLPHVYCDEVIVENKIATGVRATGCCGKQYEISANTVVVAAGGIGSPTVLQRSGIYEAGQKFFFDPFVITYGYLDKRLRPGKEFAMTCGVYLENDGIILTDMMTPAIMRRYYAAGSMNLGKLYKFKGAVAIMAKIKDDMHGSIDVTGKVTKPLTLDDRYKLNKGKTISMQIMRNMGAKKIWFSPYAAAHPGGTCRIGEIVDKNLQTKFKNLYVSDASVIPEAWGLPPVLTIVCLARRLSKHLLSK